MSARAASEPLPTIHSVTTLKAEQERPHPVPVPARAPEAPARKRRSAKSLLLPILGIAVLAAAGWYGHEYWTEGRFMISTDDAYVQADMAFVAPKITGYVARLDAEENQHVKTGDPLVTIDDGDYRIALAQAEAQIDVQNKTLERITAQIRAGRAALGQAEAQKTAAAAAATNAARTADRTAQLVKTNVSTQAQLDDARTALDQANAALAGADAQVESAKANIGVLEAQYQEAESVLPNLRLARDKAARDLSFTVLRAPYDGVVGNRSVEQGDLVSPGQKLAAIVPLNKLYIVANFKETQLAQLVPGEKVHFRVDAIDDAAFEGTVSSLSPASGAVFSLLPPNNATGNFTKIVQRLPVRIDVSEAALNSGKLRAGLSVIVDVDSRTAPPSTTASLH
ncbi:HlyD family secretion protein [Mesorhizobium sp. L-8-3]|uniref:HlyD family secretion protein n=1 Tax=Mesorhizobium sp. L-8-3 TaxID=2744522 RepID=UPI00192559DF|nr:HlyD family secretion protein [Mesorhizobium sp. L-8-3]BCH23269.1 hemolysin D [Mesorhizobium sp. L-8-3]